MKGGKKFRARTQGTTRVERVEVYYYKIEPDRHRPDCEAIDSLTFDR